MVKVNKIFILISKNFDTSFCVYILNMCIRKFIHSHLHFSKIKLTVNCEIRFRIIYLNYRNFCWYVLNVGIVLKSRLKKVAMAYKFWLTTDDVIAFKYFLIDPDN